MARLATGTKLADMPALLPAPPLDRQRDPVRSWRAECLAAAGYSQLDAVTLAERRDVDLHTAVNLLERGCSVDTALRILL